MVMTVHPEKIRPADVADLPAMCALLAELFSIETDFRVDSIRQRRGLELLMARNKNALVLVAEAEGATVGMCTVQTVISTAEGGPVALLEDLVVTRAWRGRGIGTRLLNGATEWAREHGLRRLQLLADHSNDSALRFYAREGWQATRMVALQRHP